MTAALWLRLGLEPVAARRLPASHFNVVFHQEGVAFILRDIDERDRHRMQFRAQDRAARGTVAAIIVVAHVLLAYFLLQPTRLFTTRAPSRGESVLLLVPGDLREQQEQPEVAPTEPQLEEPKAVALTEPKVEIHPATDSLAQTASGRPDVPVSLSPDAGIAVLQRVMPQYPIESVRAGEEGGTVLQVLVNEKGQASDVRVVRSSGYDRLDQAAVTAVSAWKFAPSTQGALAVPAWGELELRFNLYRFTVSRIVDAPLDLVPPGEILNAANESPVPGGADALRALINEVRSGDADAFDAPWLRDDMRRMKGALAGWGEPNEIEFKGAAAGNRWRPYEVRPEFRKGNTRDTVELRWDVYRVSHDHGVSEWRIAIDRSGRIWCAHAGRVASGNGMLQVAR